MLSHQELLEHPNYLLSTYQLEIYRQLSDYMAANNLKKQDIAHKLNVSKPYVSQILRGDFNFTLKKLIELGLMMNKVPYFEFIDPKEYWRREKEGTKEIIIKEYHYTVSSHVSQDNNNLFASLNNNVVDYKGGSLPKRVTTTISRLATAEIDG